MAELILEIFSEEIPAKMQYKASVFLEKHLATYFKENNLNNSKLKVYYTPIRLVVHIDNLPILIIQKSKEIKGPLVTAKKQAIQGFLKKNNLDSIQKLSTKNINGNDYYIIKENQKEIPFTESLTIIVQDLLCLLEKQWDKTMLWGSHKIRWIRPIKNIMCIFNQEILQIKFGHIQSNNQTSGHKFINLGKNHKIISSFKEYSEFLKNHHVVLDHIKRKQLIIQEMNSLASAKNCKALVDDNLIDNIVGIVEYPKILIGNIDKHFMLLPKEVLSMVMTEKQKYIPLLHADAETLAPYFIFVINIEPSDINKIISDHEKVLAARLYDTEYFYKNDIKEKLESKLEKLHQIIFHQDLGSLYNKSKRILSLSTFIAFWVPHANLINTKRASLLLKNDLTTELVNEFPELQGIIGSHYAQIDQEVAEVTLAIKEQYKPVSRSDSVPTQPESIVVSLADKIDTLIGLFIIGEIPTSSKDPYALRRVAISIIRIIITNNISLPLSIILSKALRLYKRQIINKHRENLSVKLFYNKITLDLEKFLLERFRFYNKENNIPNKLLEEIILKASNYKYDLYLINNIISTINQFINSIEGEQFLQSYKRVCNIINKEGCAYPTLSKVYLVKSKLKQKEEIILSTMLHDLRKEINSLIKSNNYQQALVLLTKLTIPTNSFLDNVRINCESKSLQKNRIKLLMKYTNIVHKIFRFQAILD